ncbi:MAG TPA: hypothetical protein VF681_01240 [Abditibacteriaceae bacterium]|jgi:hypothetical protein
MKSLRWKIAVGLLAVSALCVSATPSQAQNKRARIAGLEPWRGQRVLLLLPLQLGEAFNVDRAFGQAILPAAEQNLQAMLQKTGKFSVIQAHRFNPVLQRALVERRITNDQLTALVNTPNLENARAVLGKITFDQTPMIAQFILEEVRLGGTAKSTSVQAQVTGRLYELDNPVAYKSTVVTSNPQRGANVTAASVAAMNDSFARSIEEFVAPIPEIQLALPVAPAPVTPTVPAVTPVPVQPVAPVSTPAVPSSGGESLIGSSTRTPSSGVPQLPAASPPLGINVPNAPTVDR